MPSRIRFVAARNVFEAFPRLRRFAAPPADDCAPLDYARRLLASPHPSEAIVFLAHLLPRREAVWWARQCVIAILGAAAEADPATRAADAWVRAPEEETRRAALEIAAAGDESRAETWLARAAALSGGSRTAPDQEPRPPQPSACAQAANAAIILAIVAGDRPAIPAWIQACAEAGIRFADGGEAKVIAPRGPRPSPSVASKPANSPGG
jgi:hypothetical protein